MGRNLERSFAHLIPGQTVITLLADGRNYRVKTVDGDFVLITRVDDMHAAPKSIKQSEGGFVIPRQP